MEICPGLHRPSFRALLDRHERGAGGEGNDFSGWLSVENVHIWKWRCLSRDVLLSDYCGYRYYLTIFNTIIRALEQSTWMQAVDLELVDLVEWAASATASATELVQVEWVEWAMASDVATDLVQAACFQWSWHREACHAVVLWCFHPSAKYHSKSLSDQPG